MQNFFIIRIFLYDPKQKNPDDFKILSVKPSKLQKQSVFWPQTRPEANFEAVIEAGRVNLARKSPKDLKEVIATSIMLWRHPSAADSDQIIAF